MKEIAAARSLVGKPPTTADKFWDTLLPPFLAEQEGQRSMALNARLQKLSDRMREAALGPHLDGPHTKKGVLYYHYTTAQGLCGILNSRDLWATNAFYLNDPLETEYGKEFCDDYLSRQIGLDPMSHWSTYLRGCWNTMRLFADDIFPHEFQFITSFSLKGDVLSQWRAYADNGKGFSVGFSNEELLDRLCRIGAQTDEARVPRPLPMKVIYRREEQENSLANVLGVVKEDWGSLEADFLNDNETGDELKLMGAVWLATASTCFKNDAFAQEEEVRVLYSNVREMKTANTVLAARGKSQAGGMNYIDI